MPRTRLVAGQYTSEEFVESCGAILFDLSRDAVRVCLIHYGDEWVLAKGRRNCGESRQQAALREVKEETGYGCHLYPVAMSTRAPPADETGHVPDKARSFPDLTEPFMMTFRQLKGDKNVKVIWWYIATLDPNSAVDAPNGEVDFEAEFLTCEEAIMRLTFPDDRAVLERAVELLGQKGDNDTAVEL